MSNDAEVIYTLDKAGSYDLNGMKITSTKDNVQVRLIGYDAVSFATDAPIKVSTIEDGNFFMLTESDDTIQAKTVDDVKVSSGTITFNNATKKFSCAADTTVSLTRDSQVINFTADKKISAKYKSEEDIIYLDLDNNATAKFSVTKGGKTTFAGNLETGGVISYRPETGTFGLTGANSSHGDGTNTFAKISVNGYDLQMATADTTVVFIPKLVNGKLEVNFPNARKHAMAFTVSKDDQTILANNLVIDGTIGLDTAAQEISLKKNTVLTLSGDGENSLELTTLDDAGGQLQLTDNGIRFAPKAGDGKLELNFVSTGRKATLDVSSGAIILNNETLSLEKDTVLNLAWEDGTALKLSASDTGGLIGFDAQGLQVSSGGELSIDLTTATGVQTTLSGLRGTIHYNAGKVVFDANSKLTANSTLGGQPIELTLESNGTGGYVEISANGTKCVAGTGALKITWSRDGKSSTFAVNKGSVFIGHGIFEIAEGSNLSTDLKDLVPALYFTTTDAGKYTINGQTITTSAANISMTATDDYMTFKTTDDVVTYDGMTFAGNGDVSLSPANVVLGAGVVANGFGAGKSFVLAQAGNVTADARIFQLDSLNLDDGREIPMIITVTGARDGFVFSRTLTEESEEYLGYFDSPYVGSIFTEKFIAAGDSSYRIRTDPIGLEDVIGISDGAVISGGATLDDEETLSYYVLVTDTTGKFTIGSKTYTLAEGTELGTGIRARFDVDSAPYADKINDLNGTVSGDFTGDPFSINGGAAMQIFGDKKISISASDGNVEIFNLSDGATLAKTGGALKAHTDTEGAFVFGEDDSIGITVAGDKNVTFEFDADEIIKDITDIEGDLIFSETLNRCAINGIFGEFNGTFSSIGAYDDRLYLHDVTDGSSLTSDDAGKIWLQQVGASMAVNGNKFTLAGDEDGIWVREREIVGLDEGASLKVSEAGTYTVQGVTLKADAGDVIIGLEDDDAYIYDENNPLVTRKTSAPEIIDIFKPNESYIVGEDDGGKFDVTLEGGNLVVVENTAAQVNITSGDDTVISQGKNVNVSITGDSNTWLFSTGGKMTLQGYDASTGSGFGTTFSDIASAVDDGKINFDHGKLSLGSAQIDMGTRSELINFFDRTGNLQKVGFAEHDTLIDASTETADLILVGGNKATLTGGSGSDTIFAAQWSSVDAGAGNNVINLSENRNGYAGSTVDITRGTNTITNFKAGFDYASDVIANDGNRNQTFDGKNVTIKSDAGKSFLKGVGNGEAFVLLKESTDGVAYNVAAAQKNSVIAIDDELADIYIGDNSGVDFTGFKDSLTIDLTENFYGINRVTVGGGFNKLIGSSRNETLTGNDGSTEFIFGKDGGRDVIRNFNFDADKISVGNETITAVNVTDSGSVRMEISGSAVLTLNDAQGKNFKINDFTALVDKNITFNADANYFVATSDDATLTVGETADIWLDGSRGKFFVGDIRTVDASNSDGANELAGNALDNTIIAGDGDASLWGGNGGNDLLVGGAAKNNFYYVIGDGNDSIDGTNDGDIINLTATLEMISATNITADSVAINFTDGGSLRINGTADVTCVLADGSKYSANHAQREWISA